LGGESFSGWDGAQSTFVNNTSMVTSVKEGDVGGGDGDDDDDDKPLRPRPVSISFYHPSAFAISWVFKPQAERKEIGLQPVFTITVDDPQKVGDPIRAFTMYTVHTKACPI
jgi:sorting nexin-1/2